MLPLKIACYAAMHTSSAHYHPCNSTICRFKEVCDGGSVVCLTITWIAWTETGDREHDRDVPHLPKIFYGRKKSETQSTDSEQKYFGLKKNTFKYNYYSNLTTIIITAVHFYFWPACFLSTCT